MYAFFTQWKDLQHEFVYLKEEIDGLQKFYYQKIFLWQTLWEGYDKSKIDFDAAKKLSQIYEILDSAHLYQQILRKLRQIMLKEPLPSGEIEQFYDLVYMLQTNEEKQNILAKIILEDLLSGKLPEVRRFYELKDFIKLESNFLRVEDKMLNVIENIFLIKKDPGAGNVHYMHIFDALKAGVVRIKNKEVFFGDSLIQGLYIKDNVFFLKGDHYTSLENARFIQRDKYLAYTLEDPYCYLVEKAKFNTWTRDQIRKNLGIKMPETVVSFEIRIYPEQLYVCSDRSNVLKFAIVSLQREQILSVKVRSLLVA